MYLWIVDPAERHSVNKNLKVIKLKCQSFVSNLYFSPYVSQQFYCDLYLKSNNNPANSLGMIRGIFFHRSIQLQPSHLSIYLTDFSCFWVMLPWLLYPYIHPNCAQSSPSSNFGQRCSLYKDRFQATPPEVGNTAANNQTIVFRRLEFRINFHYQERWIIR